MPAGGAGDPLRGEGSEACDPAGGKFPSVKRMLASLGKPVLYLERVRMGNLPLDPAWNRAHTVLLTRGMAEPAKFLTATSENSNLANKRSVFC